jgi:hypothetical protein
VAWVQLVVAVEQHRAFDAVSPGLRIKPQLDIRHARLVARLGDAFGAPGLAHRQFQLFRRGQQLGASRQAVFDFGLGAVEALAIIDDGLLVLVLRNADGQLRRVPPDCRGSWRRYSTNTPFPSMWYRKCRLVPTSPWGAISRRCEENRDA